MGNEPGTMKLMRMEVEVLWFQLFCKLEQKKYVEVDVSFVSPTREW